MKFPYHLAEACKNTFVLFDCIENAPDKHFWQFAHAALIKENRDDAIILTLEKKTPTALYLKMHVLGVDGNFGEFCGNGSRSAAAYLFSHYRQYKQFYLVTRRGTFPLFSYGMGIYAVHLPHVQFSGDHWEILEPHVAVGKKLSNAELLRLGRSLNQNRSINVNAWEVLHPALIAVKTYERGVQRLTKSCGTGSCVCASLYLNGKGSVFVKTPGGLLLIRIQDKHLELIGPAT